MAKQPSYRVPVSPDHKPSYFNKDALLGTLLFGFSFFGLGAVVGGVLGKRHQQHQADEGKVVKPPTVWNKDLLIGGLVGSNLAVLPYAAAALIGASVAAPLLVAGAIAILPLTAIGAFMGARRGKNIMAKEYAQAESYVAQHGQFNPSAEVTPSPSVSPAIAQAVGLQQAPVNAVSMTQAATQIRPEELRSLDAYARQGNQMAMEAARTETARTMQTTRNAQGTFVEREMERAARVPVSSGRGAA